MRSKFKLKGAIIMNNQVVSNQINRGDIFFVDFGTSNGRVQGSKRPACVVSNEKCNEMSPVITVVALTSNVEKAKAKKLPTQVFISKECGLTSDSIALCEQPRSIDKSQLDYNIGKIGTVDNETMILIEKALMIQVGIKNVNTNVNQVINVNKNVDLDIAHAKELLLKISELSKLSKEINKPITTLESLKKEFKSYCNKFNKDYKDVTAQIRLMMSAKQENREMVLC